jgi:glycosyltransferase involved in cell wall biosynthesis
VRVLGRIGPAEVQERMRRAAYLVMPSLAYEALPRPLIEAFANALPVIASRLGALAELIEPGRNGLLFEPGSARDLARRLAWAEAFPEKMRQMGECARADYEARFLADWSYQRLFGERRKTARISQ